MKKLLQSLHKHFIPSAKNAYQPHFLRFRTAAGILGLVLCLEAVYLTFSFMVIPQSGRLAAIFAAVLVDQTNIERSHENVGGLTPNEILVKAAQMKADDMAAKGYFSHVSPDGKTPWYWFKAAGYDYAAAGENLAVNFTDSKDVTSAWMHSESHRANILNDNYTEIGIATAKGVYKGKDVIFVVQEFGRPSLVAQVTGHANENGSATTSTTIGEPKEALLPIVQKPITIKPTPKATTTPTPTPVAAPLRVATATTSTSTSTTIVAGAETTKLDVPVAPISSPVLETVRISKFDLLLASPRQATTIIYLILAAILAFALGLAIFIKIRIQHAHIIANGILLIAIIISLVLLNAAIGVQGVI